MFGSLDKDFLWAAKYPFDKKSIELLQSLSITIKEVIEDKTYIEDALANLREIIEMGQLKKDILENPYRSFVLFYIELLLVRAIEDSYIENRFVEVISKRIYDSLKMEKIHSLKEIAVNLGFDVTIDNGEPANYIKIYFTDFLKAIRRLSSRHWRLYYFPVSNGYVFLSKNAFIRILREAVKSKIYEMILSIDSIPNEISEIAEEFYNEISSLLPKRSPVIFDVETKNEKFFPPCIRYLLKYIGSGLTHPARFTLVTFLNAVGYTKEEIVNLFTITPDFNEKVTKYQVEHILGLRGGKIKYNVPSCRKIVSYNFCFQDSTCKKFNVIHPLKYVYLKKRYGK